LFAFVKKDLVVCEVKFCCCSIPDPFIKTGILGISFFTHAWYCYLSTLPSEKFMATKMVLTMRVQIPVLLIYFVLYLSQYRYVHSFTVFTKSSGALFESTKWKTACIPQHRQHVSANCAAASVIYDGQNDGDDEDDTSLVNESELVMEYDDDDDEEDDDGNEADADPYMQVAASEFTSNTKSASKSTDLVLSNEMSTSLDWGGALGKLRERLDDMEQGKSGNPSQALFRLMSAQSPNQAIGSFVQSASPQVVQAMSSAVSSLLGGLSSPTSGIETIVKATGSKIGTLCFQLQMTG
jgi:Protein of unknown function (DUF760)